MRNHLWCPNDPREGIDEEEEEEDEPFCRTPGVQFFPLLALAVALANTSRL